MPLGKEYDNHSEVLLMIQKAQDSEQDQRDKVREAKRFITQRDGQWDDYAAKKMDGRFRGTFDMCTPIIDGISGEIEQSDFTIRVSPSNGQGSKDTAKVMDGLIRNIRNISNAESVFNAMGRADVIGGFDCCEIVQDWVEGDSFDQDLFIRHVPNAVDSVWFDLSSVLQDRSDANWAIKLVSIPRGEYEARFKDGSAVSIGDNARYHGGDQCNNAKESVTIGKLYYKKPRDIEIVLMSNGAVYKVDDDFEKIRDELSQAGIREERRRTRKAHRVYSRIMDGAGWLAGEEETVFDYIPLVPIYGNYDIVDNNTIYYGKIENLYDSQRVLNYALSRDIEDGALSPSPAIWMTDEQAEGNDYSQMNVDRDPVRVYNHQDNVPPPIPMGGPIASQGLQATIQNTKEMITISSNTFQAQQGNANAQQSGIAGLQQIEQGNVGNIKWFKDLEVTICQVGKVIVNAIPRVYDATRQARILEEDGTGNTVTLNDTILDQQTGQLVTVNDLSVGEYDVLCEVGPAFNSAQKEAARSFEAMATIMPEFAQMGMDIWLKNKKEPGMDQMAERFREQLLNAGVIPQEQWTDEERQKIEAAQAAAASQPPQADPMQLAAMAEMEKAKADQKEVERKGIENEKTNQLKIAELQLKQQELELRKAESQSDAEVKLMKNKIDEYKAQIEAAKAGAQVQKLEVDTQKTLSEIQSLDVESLAALASGLVGGSDVSK